MMGEMADWFIEQHIDSMTEPEIDFDEIFDNKEWLTASRERIKIKNMTTSHINNVIKCFEGKSSNGTTIPDNWAGRNKSDWLKLFTDELSTRNE